MSYAVLYVLYLEVVIEKTPSKAGHHGQDLLHKVGSHGRVKAFDNFGVELIRDISASPIA